MMQAMQAPKEGDLVAKNMLPPNRKVQDQKAHDPNPRPRQVQPVHHAKVE
jgi:hypothetical protein